MSNNILVSVVVAAYNHQDYVQETIKSIIAQTYQNIELIIIDDGSKDNTWQKIQELKDSCQKRFSNFIAETKQNEGTAKTLNKLLAKAKGKYIYFIASDDISYPKAIEKELDFLEKNPSYLLAVGDNALIDTEGKECYWDKERNIIYDKQQAKYLTFKEFLQEDCEIDFNSENFGKYKQLYLGNHIPNGYLFRKNILDKIPPFTDEAPLEDYYLMLQISKYGKLKFFDKVLYFYRWHQNNTIKNNKKINFFTKKTRDYEEEIFNNLDEKEVLPEILKIKKLGFLYRKIYLGFIKKIIRYIERFLHANK